MPIPPSIAASSLPGPSNPPADAARILSKLCPALAAPSTKFANLSTLPALNCCKLIPVFCTSLFIPAITAALCPIVAANNCVRSVNGGNPKNCCLKYSTPVSPPIANASAIAC